MTLGRLLEDAGVVALHGPPGLDVRGLAYDSRRVAAGDVFFALSGLRSDGARYLDQAFASGAVAAVVPAGTPVSDRPLVEVEEPRRALAVAAARFHGDPSHALKVVGVTGTNGKTTTTYLLESIFRAAGWTPGVIGTTGIRVGDRERPSAFTTPESTELQALFREMAEAEVAAVAMEVSSHALVQRRAFGVAFDAVAFTNFTQDHLDYHGTMEAYLDAKLTLFDGRNGASPKRPVAIVNADDPASARVAEAAVRGGLGVLRVGALEAPDREPLAVRLARVRPAQRGLEIEAIVRSELPARAFTLPLLGRYNAANAAVAYGAALGLGLESATIERGLSSLAGVPGRLEAVDAGQRFAVRVDFAHTPDALERAIAAVREHGATRVLLVFGCGGDRDRGKRPLMGRIAAGRCDLAWITNDNPRGEDPAAIASEIAAGDPSGRLKITLDRRAAIAEALSRARWGDTVLIAGKGHETTQTIGDSVLPFDDRAIARELLGLGGRA